MKPLIKTSFVIVFLIALFSCEKDELPPIDRSKITTEFYGLFALKVYYENPFESKKVKPIYTENIYYNDEYPFQVLFTGTGSCGEGYENIANQWLRTEIALTEYDLTKPEYTSFIRNFNIGLAADCDAHRTKESFFNLFESDKYNFALNEEDNGKFIVTFIIRDKVFSSLNVDNSIFKVDISEIENIEPLNSITGENNWDPASVKATLKFSCLLRDMDGKFALIENAEIRGIFFQQAPWGFKWNE